MKENLDDDKMIRERVKVEMNKFLGDVLKNVCKQLNEYPYTTIEYEMLKESTYPYTNTDLKPVMSALGMPTAFDPYKADFQYFCNYPTYIDLMKQVAKIQVNEEGTEAAAITVIGFEATGMPDFAEFHATRPFLYIISERSTGLIFFIGQYMGDTTTGISDRQMVNGQWSNGKCFDLQGRQIVNGQWSNGKCKKGLYIVAGKKYIVD